MPRAGDGPRRHATRRAEEGSTAGRGHARLRGRERAEAVRLNAGRDYFAGPTDVETVATLSACALVNVAVCRMSSEEAPTLTV